jgi:hypothetical protein
VLLLLLLLRYCAAPQATVYRCHPQGRIEVLQVYVDDHTQRLNGEVRLMYV